MPIDVSRRPLLAALPARRDGEDEGGRHHRRPFRDRQRLETFMADLEKGG